MNNIKLELVNLSFPFNIGSGYAIAEQYAKNNNMKLHTTYKEYTDNIVRWYNKYKRYPTDYMFVFEKISN